ncbi:hypothetical protein AVANS14531_00090 [Campylobacter sp. Cr9]|uniref:hypothetical protein n=1 Tax=Campylobacter sp. Cr9 TaxID=2735728 RepID=UPI003014F659|nr:hypothetical protein [Campylobacter sp. Cr9]
MNFYQKLENLEIIYFKDCFRHCNGHCCNANKDYNVVIPMLKSEYEYIKNKVKLKLIASIDYKLICGKTITLCFLECDLKGLCDFRPLACKLYPFFANIDDEQNIINLREISLYDMFYKNLKSHPCYLVSNHYEKTKEQFIQNIKEIINEPILIFNFMALELLRKYLKIYFNSLYDEFYLDNIQNKKEILHKNNFLKAWQNDDFKKEFNELYEKLSKKFKKSLDEYLVNN